MVLADPDLEPVMRFVLPALILASLLTRTATAQTTTVYTANPYLGTPISPYDASVSAYSPSGALNPYTTGGGKIYARDGTYLGRLDVRPLRSRVSLQPVWDLRVSVLGNLDQ